MDKPDKPRRDFLFIATGAVAAIGAVAITRTIMSPMSPAGDSPKFTGNGLDLDISSLQEGEQMTVTYLGRPIAIRHRTAVEIAAAQRDDEADLIHVEADQDRLRPKPDGNLDSRFLVFYPICTHLGCVVIGEAGDFDGWFCPCHAAHFDTSGRVRKGPAPINLKIPNYNWASNDVIKFHKQQPYGYSNGG